MRDEIFLAKQRLPLPTLMHRLGLREHAKKSARCPFHDDKHNSFSVYKNVKGEFRFKCFASCGEGDEITFLEKYHGISKKEATKLFLEMAGVNGAMPSPSKQGSTPAFDWQSCVNAFTDADMLSLQIQRRYSREICSWLKENGFIGKYENCFAFPLHNHAGDVVACHYRLKDGIWLYYPKGAKVRPLVVGDLIPGGTVHIFESYWDAFAFMNKSGERSGIIITRGAANGKLVAGLVPAGATVYAWKQNDELKDGKRAGDEWLTDVAAHVGTKVLWAKTPEKFKDLNDWTRAGATDRELIDAIATAELIRQAAPVNLPNEAEAILVRLNSPLPKVQLPGDGRLLSAFAVDCAEVLKDCGIYQRGGVAFIVNQQRDGLDVITAPMLRTLAEQHLVCYRVRSSGDNVVSLPRTMSTEDAQGMLSAQQFLSRLPKVARIATARLPVMRGNGVIELLPAGYDAASSTLTLPHCDYEVALPMSVATQTIDELLAEFPFADDGRSKAVAVSAMVGLFAAGLLRTGMARPVFIYLANAEGAGKTLIAKCAISPNHGLVKTDGDLKDKAETAKELLAAVIETRPYILFDNCKRHLDSPYLEAFVSSTMWSGRILGVSKMFAGENLMTVFVTGNGCTVSPDMRRRALFVELFMENERAEDRKFKRVLDDAALLALRPRILAALWALVRAWDAAGRPKPSRTHTAFPRWAEIVGGIVEHAGYGCPLAAAEIPSAADVDGADMRELVKVLAHGEPLKFDELVIVARENGLFERIIGSDDGELKPSDKSTFGKLLKRYNRRVFRGGRSFVIDGKGRYKTFRVAGG
jgi:CHC2 zinc finger